MEKLEKVNTIQAASYFLEQLIHATDRLRHNEQCPGLPISSNKQALIYVQSALRIGIGELEKL